jgi:hypothetical protein
MRARLSHRPPRQSKEQRVIEYLYNAIATGSDVEIYAPIDCRDFIYKVFCFSPFGVLGSDTGYERIVSRTFAKRVIRHQDLSQVSLNDLMCNWLRWGVWSSRPISAALLQHWVTLHAQECLALYAICAAMKQPDPMAQLLAGLAGRMS